MTGPTLRETLAWKMAGMIGNQGEIDGSGVPRFVLDWDSSLIERREQLVRYLLEAK